MFIVLVLFFFKSICLYCQRVILCIYDQWINPKNTRLLKEAIEAKGSRLEREHMRRVTSPTYQNRRRKAGNFRLSHSGGVGGKDAEHCTFCYNTPQGYCRHHFHLQELHVHKLQQQQQRQEQHCLWFPLKENFEKSVDLRQLRKIKRTLKSYLHEEQLHKVSTRNILYKGSHIKCEKYGCDDDWTWSRIYCSDEVVLSGPSDRTVHFHPNWSKGTAGVRGERVLNNARHYWELHVTQRVFGTSIMFGIGTNHTCLHANTFRNMLGENENSWGLSHKGILWHQGVAQLYTKGFKENQATVVGILFDGIDGTLTYYKDGECLGVAFRGLEKIKEPLYPMVCSTAAKSEMTLKCTRRDIANLQDRCRSIIVKQIKMSQDLNKLKLPSIISDYLSEAMSDCTPFRRISKYDPLLYM